MLTPRNNEVTSCLRTKHSMTKCKARTWTRASRPRTLSMSVSTTSSTNWRPTSVHKYSNIKWKLRDLGESPVHCWWVTWCQKPCSFQSQSRPSREVIACKSPAVTCSMWSDHCNAPPWNANITDTKLSPSITQSAFHSRLRAHMIHKSFPP